MGICTFMNQQVLMCVAVAREWEQGEIKQAGLTMSQSLSWGLLLHCHPQEEFGLAPLSGCPSLWTKTRWGINLRAVWTVLSPNKQHNQMINWDNVLLKVAGDRWLSPFPCALKQADKAAALWCANTQTHPCLLCLLPGACAPQPVRQCCSVASL